MNFYSLTDVEDKISGGKSQNLARLARENICVAPAIVSETMTIEEWRLDKAANEFSSSILDSFKNTDWLHKQIIIRSSAEGEDSAVSSSAGIFNSIVLELSAHDFNERFRELFVFDGLNIPINQMLTLVVQPFIECKVSGVCFTANPVTGENDKALIECTNGHLSAILSSGIEPDRIKINNVSKTITTDVPPYLNHEALLNLFSIINKIRNIFATEIDVEWAINAEDEIFIFQARPIVFPSAKLFQVSHDNSVLIPNVIRNNPKIDLRLKAEANSIHMSPAWISISTLQESTQEGLKNSEFRKSKNFSGFSTVLIWPSKINGQTKRAFVGKKNFAASAFRHCRRYTVRDFPPYEKVSESIQEMDELSFSTNVYSISIIQTIYRARYTGIVQKFSDKILVEIAYGHFVPKGIVDTQKFIFDEEMNLISVDYGNQSVAYEIIEGSIVDCKLDEVIKIAPLEVEKIILKFRPLLSPGTLIEFGCLRKHLGNENELYLIDLVETDAESDTSFDPNVISAGSISGKVTFLEAKTDKAFHAHLNTDFIGEETVSNTDKIVYVSKYPDISLAKHLIDMDPGLVSFVFHHGSILCHLAVLLREGGFSSRILPHSANWKEGIEVDLK